MPATAHSTFHTFDELSPEVSVFTMHPTHIESQDMPTTKLTISTVDPLHRKVGPPMSAPRSKRSTRTIPPPLTQDRSFYIPRRPAPRPPMPAFSFPCTASAIPIIAVGHPTLCCTVSVRKPRENQHQPKPAVCPRSRPHVRSSEVISPLRYELTHDNLAEVAASASANQIVADIDTESVSSRSHRLSSPNTSSDKTVSTCPTLMSDSVEDLESDTDSDFETELEHQQVETALAQPQILLCEMPSKNQTIVIVDECPVSALDDDIDNNNYSDSHSISDVDEEGEDADDESSLNGSDLEDYEEAHSSDEDEDEEQWSASDFLDEYGSSSSSSSSSPSSTSTTSQTSPLSLPRHRETSIVQWMRGCDVRACYRASDLTSRRRGGSNADEGRGRRRSRQTNDERREIQFREVVW